MGPVGNDMTLMLFVSVLAIFWPLTSVNSEFLPRPTGLRYVREFSTATIPWKFRTSGPIVSVYWKYTKPGSLDVENIYAADGKGVNVPVGSNQFNNRVEFIGNFRIEPKDATLAIREFKKEDEGDFECEVSSVTRFAQKVSIKVTVLSNVTDFKLVGTDDVKQGDNVTLSCTASKGEHIPAPNIKILRGNQVLNESEISNMTAITVLQYHFDRISKDASGPYVCLATTDGFLSRKELQLDIKYPPEFSQASNLEQFGCLGKEMTLGCPATGNPNPKLFFFDPDGTPLTANSFKLMKFGTYRCEATNKLGNNSVNVTVKEAKDKPEKPNVECSLDKITWQQSPAPNVNFTVQMRSAGSNEPWKNVITSTDTSYSPSANKLSLEQKDYEFRIVASNCVGDEYSERCIVKASSGERSGGGPNAGLIAGCVVAALVVLLIIVIAVVCFKRRKQGAFKKSVPGKLNDSHSKSSEVKGNTAQKPGGLLYGDSPNGSQPRVRPPSKYREDDDDDDEFDSDQDSPIAQTSSNSVPSWV